MSDKMGGEAVVKDYLLFIKDLREKDLTYEELLDLLEEKMADIVARDMHIMELERHLGGAKVSTKQFKQILTEHELNTINALTGVIVRPVLDV